MLLSASSILRSQPLWAAPRFPTNKLSSTSTKDSDNDEVDRRSERVSTCEVGRRYEPDEDERRRSRESALPVQHRALLGVPPRRTARRTRGPADGPFPGSVALFHQ